MLLIEADDVTGGTDECEFNVGDGADSADDGAIVIVVCGGSEAMLAAATGVSVTFSMVVSSRRRGDGLSSAPMSTPRLIKWAVIMSSLDGVDIDIDNDDDDADE